MGDGRNISTSGGRWKHTWIRLSIWSLKRHDHLISVLRMFTWSFSAVVVLAAVVGRLGLETALCVIGFGGLSAVVLLTGLVLIRRNVLLGIDDPVLRTEAHQAMLALIRSRSSMHPARRAQSDPKARTDASSCLQTGECGR